MAVGKVLARDWGKKIGSTEIKGIHAFSIASQKQDADVTDFESNGRNEHVVASRGTTITLEGYFMEDVSTGARDPGQEAVETLAGLVGPTSIAAFTLTTPGGTTWVFNASADVEGPGGDTNAAASWKCTLMVSGSIVIT